MSEMRDRPNGSTITTTNIRAQEALFDQIEDTVYFLKDSSGRYLSVNQTLVKRCGRHSKAGLIGSTSKDVFPEPLGRIIFDQDQHVLQSGKGLQSKLELHLYADGREGWCLTWKEPLRNDDGTVVGLSGISRDLRQESSQQVDFASLSLVLDHIQKNFDEPLRHPKLASLAGMSRYQLDRRLRALTGLSVGQYITKQRISHACHKLRHTSEPISTIALDCGYSDQASFSRQFRQSLGLSPQQYRKSIAIPDHRNAVGIEKNP